MKVIGQTTHRLITGENGLNEFTRKVNAALKDGAKAVPHTLAIAAVSGFPSMTKYAIDIEED
jgi:hypothetical protein